MINKNLASFLQKSSLTAVLTIGLCSPLHAFNSEDEVKPVEPIEYSISESSIITVPVIKDALIFTSLTDAMPAVVNYFTKEEESDIIKFYEENYGAVIYRESKYGRLTLTFKKEANTIRVAITQQNNKRQVDIIVEETK
jgi:hypothetical protein